MLYRWAIAITLTSALACAATDPAEPTPPAEPAEPSKAAPNDDPLGRTFTLPLPLFSPDSAWNQRADQATVLPESDAQILTTYRVLLGDVSTQIPAGPPSTTWPFADVSYDDYSIPIYATGPATTSITICDYYGELSWGSHKLPIDALGDPLTVAGSDGPVRPAGPQSLDADGHVVLFDAGSATEWDFWSATTSRQGACNSDGGGITGDMILEAGAVERFNVGSLGVNDDDMSSARAAGTPLLAGLIVPEDVESGAIAHALALAIPGLRSTSGNPQQPSPNDWMWPTSTTETDFINTDPTALAAGQRLRLKAQVLDEDGLVIDEQTLAPITRMFLGALRSHGAILVDNAGGFSFSAEDVHTARLDLSDAQVAALAGLDELPGGVRRWAVVMEALNDDLERIPFAVSDFADGDDPAAATLETANYEVVEPATAP